jgi:uncharacterized protein YbaR (Trm112 family)
MTPWLLDKLSDPIGKGPLRLTKAVYDASGDIMQGTLVSDRGCEYPVIDGIPRFVDPSLYASVRSFGDEWNYFNFVDFKSHWLNHTVRNTFETVDSFRDQVVVDCGGGSGAQTLWMLESGARHVVMLELSHSVDDVVQRNLRSSGFRNFDVIQCSIDAPPLRPRSINGIVICHNVIQHTPSVEHTARALFEIVGTGGEFVFNCYPLNDTTPLRWIRHHLVHIPLREGLRRMPFQVTLAYARTVGMLRLVPGLGLLLEKCYICQQGDVPHVSGESVGSTLRRRYAATVLNTFDWYGAHRYQHYKSAAELRRLVAELQPDRSRVENLDRCLGARPPIGTAIRVKR